MSQFIVGVTGGIGAGKTAVTDIFQQLGIDVVDADVVAREVVQPGKPALAQLIDVFGEQMIQPDGELNRAKLRQLVFTDGAAKQQLNDIMHPAIRTELTQQLQQAKSAYAILAAPLLLENNLQSYINSLVVVDVPEELQLARASSRDQVQVQQIKAIMSSQCSRQQRLEQADHVIDNSGPLLALNEQVEDLHQQFMTQIQLSAEL